MTAAPSLPAPSRRLGREIAWTAAALLLGAGLFVVALALNLELADDLGVDTGSPRFLLLVLLDLALGVAAVAALPLRHRFPVAVAAGLAIAAALSAFAGPAAFLALVSLAARRRPLEIAAVAALWVTAMAAASLTGAGPVGAPETVLDMLPTLAVLLVLLMAAIAGGLWVGSRRALLEALRERARLAEEEQRLRENTARDQERARIAREMHDVLAHRLSLTAMHASALRYRSDLDDDERRAAVETVHDNARGALGELREILSVVRDAGGDESDAPQPTLADLGALVAAEPHIELLLELELAAVPPLVGRHAYRIVQECLTNARRHAPGHPVRVVVGGRVGERLRLTVENPSPDGGGAPGPDGFGLIGIRERAETLGGTVEIRRTAGMHTVIADLPWTTA